MPDDLAPLVAFEREIAYPTPHPTPAQGIVVKLGRVPVLFSAPHACQHKRAGRWKAEDEYTAAIALWLHHTTGAHAIYLSHRIDPDPHDDGDNNPYKQRLADFVEQSPVRLVIDLHGVRGDRPFGIGLGTMNGLTCPDDEAQIIAHFESTGFLRHAAPSPIETLALNHPQYTGGLIRPTITRFVHQGLAIPAIQIEINAWARIVERLPHSTNAKNKTAPDFRGSSVLIRRMLTALVRITQTFA